MPPNIQRNPHQPRISNNQLPPKLDIQFRLPNPIVPMYQWCPDLKQFNTNLAPLLRNEEGLQRQCFVGDAGFVDFSEDHYYDLLGEGGYVDHGGDLLVVLD